MYWNFSALEPMSPYPKTLFSSCSSCLDRVDRDVVAKLRFVNLNQPGDLKQQTLPSNNGVIIAAQVDDDSKTWNQG